MRPFALLAVPAAFATTLAMASAAHAGDVTLYAHASLPQVPADVVITPPAGQSGGGRLHVESHGCLIESHGFGFVNHGASIDGNHGTKTSCSVTIEAVNCRPKELVRYTVFAEQSFAFEPRVSGSAPDAAAFFDARIESLGHTTLVGVDAASAYQQYALPAPSKKNPNAYLLPLVNWFMTASLDEVRISTNNGATFKTGPGMPLVTGPGNTDSTIELSMVNAFGPKAISNMTSLDDQLYCGQTRVYSASTALSSTISVEAFDALFADLDFSAELDVVFSARAR